MATKAEQFVAQPTEKMQGLLDRIVEHQQEVASRYMPTLTPKQFTEREKLIADLRQMLQEGVDYGVIPGTDKPTLLLPGAQKVCAYFGYVPAYAFDEKIESWTVEKYGEMLFYYSITCNLEKDGKRVGSGLGSCNSWESKYRYRWLNEDDAAERYDLTGLPRRNSTITEFVFAIDKAETSGKYGKPKAYWDRWQLAITSGEAKHVKRMTSKGREMDAWELGGVQVRVPNPDVADQINTVLKIAKKRAYIDATLSATGLSQYFTQDLEDMTEPHMAPTPDHTPEKPAEPQKRPIPDALRDTFRGMRKDLSIAVAAYTKMENMFIQRGGDEGMAEYNRIADAFNEKYPNGTSDVSAHEAFLLDLWEALDMLQPKEAQ